MTEQPQFVLVPADDLRKLANEVSSLREVITGATITPRPEWLTIPEAATAIGVSVATIRRRIGAGEIEARGIGATRRVRINRGA